jgi:carbamate kinase
MRVVVALGGNALLRRDQPMSVETQRANVAVASRHLAAVAHDDEIVVSHGNGPQIGLLALEEAAYEPTPDAPLDVLGAETQGMIGYLLEQELANQLPSDRPLATLLTMIEVDRDDPAFADPSKPIGPWYSREDADRLGAEHGWDFKPDGDQLRRVVPSPTPRHILEIDQIRMLLERRCIVICAGGGGIPTVRDTDGRITGVEAVIDKDHASGLLARDVGADVLVMATEAPGVFFGFGTPSQRLVSAAHPDAIMPAHEAEFTAGSMLPKVVAACEFARATGNAAAIGALADIEALIAGVAGTRIAADVEGVHLDDP